MGSGLCGGLVDSTIHPLRKKKTHTPSKRVPRFQICSKIHILKSQNKFQISEHFKFFPQEIHCKIVNLGTNFKSRNMFWGWVCSEIWNYGNIVEFINDKQLDITQAPPRAKELIHYIVNRINDSSHNLFRTVIKLPSSQEVHRELRERISEKDLKSLRNNEKFQSDVLDQLLLVKLRNFFSKSKLT